LKKNQIAVQLYSFRDFIKTPKEFAETLAKLKKMGYDTVQLSGSIAPMPESELTRILGGEGIAAPTAHENQTKIVCETQAVTDRLLSLGCHHVAYPYPHQLPANESETVKLAGGLNRTAEKMAAAGIGLAYHNHAVEFLRYGGKTMLEIIYDEAPALGAEIDTFWVQAGGGSPADWTRRTKGRMEVIHLKDFAVIDNHRRAMAPVGSGNLNWTEIIGECERSGVKYFVVEHDGDCADPFASFQSSMSYLTDNFVR
jgi:sugar phosphate isomerase/epimerase